MAKKVQVPEPMGIIMSRQEDVLRSGSPEVIRDWAAARRAARDKALVEESDPFSYGRTMAHFRMGLIRLDDTQRDAKRALASRRHRHAV